MSNNASAQDFLNQIAAAMPQVKANKNGYEIRTQILELATQSVWQDYYAKWGQYESSITKDGTQIVADIKVPKVPGTEEVLEAAEKFYSFVNSNK